MCPVRCVTYLSGRTVLLMMAPFTQELEPPVIPGRFTCYPGAHYPDAHCIAQVDVNHIYRNCPRYVPEMEMVAPSRHIP